MGVKWRNVVTESIRLASRFKHDVGSPPTLRALFYILVSKNVIPNTKSAYVRLSQVISEARIGGAYPWELLKDESKPVIENEEGNTLDFIKKHAENIYLYKLDEVRGALEKISLKHGNYWVRRWEDQPQQVLICLEKGALKDAVQTIVEDWELPLYVMRGYPSTTQINAVAKKVAQYEPGATTILTLGDFDPTGEDISRSIGDKLSESFGVNCNVERVFVTMEQINAYGLPHDPDDEGERRKMERDPRFKSWEHGFYRVELDALLAYKPDEFKRILSDAIKSHFDMSIYNAVIRGRLECDEEAEANLVRLREDLAPIMDEVNRIYTTMEVG